MDASINESSNDESPSVGRMRADVKAQWVAALRSGEYQQGGGNLYNTSDNTHCCLGVLCELAVQAGIIQPKAVTDSGSYFAGDSSILPSAVQDWAALDSPDPDDCQGRTLSDMNDSDVSFIEIAGVIERDL